MKINWPGNKNKNRNRNIIIAAVCLVLIIIASLIFFKKSDQPVAVKNNPLAGLSINGAQAQIYSVGAAPQLAEDDKIFGSKKARLNIFVYEDYTSPFSAALADNLEKIKAEFGDDLAIIVRPYFKNYSVAIQAALAVDCAGAQGKWTAMRALLFARAKNKQLAPADFSGYISQLGLQAEEFNNCLTNEQKSGKMEKLLSEAEAYLVQAEPTMFIGGEMVLGARPYADFVDSNGDKIIGLKNLVTEKLK
jgi:protein-disulfide isomerase